MTELWLNKISLRRDQREQLWSEGRSLQDPHRLLWSFFPAPDGAARDFLFRQESSGASSVFFVLSRRRPEAPSGLWDVRTTRFAPALRAGQVLEFSLRANPVQRVLDVQRRFPDMEAGEQARLQKTLADRIERRARGDGGKARPGRADEKHDVVMMRKLAQRHLPPEQRDDESTLVREAGLAWLRRQAEGDGKQSKGAGFTFDAGRVQADGYRQHRLARGERARDMTFSTLEFSGLLTVTDPALMVEKLWTGPTPGLGSARGFGCGLMLVRKPAPSWLADPDDEDEDDA